FADVGAMAEANHIERITNRLIIDELENDRPVLYCNQHHAMVVVDFNYLFGPGGSIIPQQVGVLDPWPYSAPYHALTYPEIAASTLGTGGQMTFLAAVNVAASSGPHSADTTLQSKDLNFSGPSSPQRPDLNFSDKTRTSPDLNFSRP